MVTPQWHQYLLLSQGPRLRGFAQVMEGSGKDLRGRGVAAGHAVHARRCEGAGPGGTGVVMMDDGESVSMLFLSFKPCHGKCSRLVMRICHGKRSWLVLMVSQEPSFVVVWAFLWAICALCPQIKTCWALGINTYCCSRREFKHR